MEGGLSGSLFTCVQYVVLYNPCRFVYLCLPNLLVMKKIAFFLAIVISSISLLGQNTDVPHSHLKGRSVVGALPRPVYDSEESGTVVVSIWVDNYGNVTKAQAGAEGTTTNNKKLWTAARDAAMKAHFNQKADAPALQEGTITYIFTLVGERQKAIQNSFEYDDEIIDETALKFLGIPVDGSKERMVAQLKEKGFDGSVWSEYLEGQFNGDPVKVFVHTYHEKVDRIIVEFDRVQEMSTREQYNNLLSLLEANEKYKSLEDNQPIPNNSTLAAFTVQNYKARFGYYSFNSPEELSGEVWLMLLGNSVNLYYDNFKNRPHGEDL